MNELELKRRELDYLEADLRFRMKQHEENMEIQWKRLALEVKREARIRKKEQYLYPYKSKKKPKSNLRRVK